MYMCRHIYQQCLKFKIPPQLATTPAFNNDVNMFGTSFGCPGKGWTVQEAGGAPDL